MPLLPTLLLQNTPLGGVTGHAAPAVRGGAVTQMQQAARARRLSISDGVQYQHMSG